MKHPERAFAPRPHTCPWWFGYAIDNPIRRLLHDPAVILKDLVGEGQTAVDIGCGLGYFSLALAEIVGPRGTVIAFDLQSQMIQRARRRAGRRGMGQRIDFRVCAPNHLGLAEPVDLALAFWMVHEVADPSALLTEVWSALRPSGHLLIVEPKIHVPRQRFEKMVRLARATGFEVAEGPPVRLSRSMLCSPQQAEGGHLP